MRMEKQFSREVFINNPLVWINQQDHVSFQDNKTKDWDAGGVIQSIYKEETGEWYVDVETSSGKSERIDLNSVLSVRIFE